MSSFSPALLVCEHFPIVFLFTPIEQVRGFWAHEKSFLNISIKLNDRWKYTHYSTPTVVIMVPESSPLHC